MPVTTPKLALPKVQGPENARDYLKGAIAGGGLWRALEILDNAILSTGAITLDNATLNNPTIVGWTNANHTHASVAQAGSALGPGATLSSPAFAGVISTGAQFAGNVGVGVAAAALNAGRRGVFLGDGALVMGGSGFNAVELRANSYPDTANVQRALAAVAAGQLTMDTNTLVYANAPSVAAGAAQTFTTRLTVGASGNVGIGVTPSAWHPLRTVVQVGGALAVVGNVGGIGTQLADNTYLDAAAASRAIFAQAAAKLTMNYSPGTLQFENAPSVAAGAIQTFTTRVDVSATGTLTLTPAAGNAALDTGRLRLTNGAGANDGMLQCALGDLVFYAGSQQVVPQGDAFFNMGKPTLRWANVYASVGTINTSLAEAKQDITPLAPAAALAAVLATDPVRFTYRAPVLTAVQYELPDDPEQAQEVLYQRLVNGPLMEAARSQAGFVLDDATGQYQTDPLFETGKGQSNAAHTAGILLAALHAIDARLTALEGA